MSLQVWLPLNGSIENQGLSNVTVTGNGVTVNNSGKIGSCYSFDGTDDGILLDNLVDMEKWLANEISVAFWIYHTDTGSRAVIFGQYSMSGARAGGCFNIEKGNSSSSNRECLRVDFSSHSDHLSSVFTIPESTWTHIVVAKSADNNVYTYKNGELCETYKISQPTSGYTGSQYYIGRDGRTGDTCLKGKINDFRIYNHCLSVKEVKEISKALTIHYTLDDFTLKSENIMPNSLEMELGSANPSLGRWRLAGTSNMDRSRVAISDSPYGSCYGFQNSGIQTANDGSCYGIDSFPLEANTVYTISMYARITSGTEGYAGFNIYNSTHGSGSWTKVDKNYYVTPLNSNGRWTRCWITITTNSSTTRNIYIGITTGDTTVTTQMCCVRIEKGTPNFDTIYDSSGYMRNVTPTVKLVDSTNTPRYCGCIQLDGFNDHIVVPYNATCPDNIFTVNLWFYKYSLGTKSYETLFGGPSGFEMDTRAGAATTMSLYMTSTRGGNVFSPFALNTWYMVTMVRDGTHEMYYVNGNLKKTIDAKAMPTGTYFIGAWSSSTSQNYKGLISDFRLYNTPLSSSDILELYQTASSVDRDGNLYAYDFKEVPAS